MFSRGIRDPVNIPAVFTARIFQIDGLMTVKTKVRGRLKEDHSILHLRNNARVTEVSRSVQYCDF